MERKEPNIEQLEQGMREGDETALANLFELNRARFLRMVSMRMDKHLRGRIDPADILQDAYVDLSKRLDSYAKYESMSGYVWMRLTIRDRLIAIYRQHIQAGKRDARREVSIHKRANPDESSTEMVATLADSFSSIGGKAAKAEIADLIQDALAKMDPNDRDIIIMRTFEGMTNLEAAEYLGLSPNGASSRFSRALERLQKEVSTAMPR